MKGQGAIVFLVVFAIGFLLTLASPTLPPGRIIYDTLGLPDTAYPVLGIAGPTLGSAIFNGVIYGVIVWLIFTILKREPKQKEEISKQIPSKPIEEQTPSQKVVEEQKPEQHTPETIAYGRLNVIDVEGIGPTYANKLKDLGINTTDDLLEAGSTRKGREDLSEKTDISTTLILEWVNLSDLVRIRGVGEEYSDLLEEAGVDTVVELSRRNPENLHAKILEVNEEKNLVRRPPTLTEIKSWIEQAKNLPRKIEY